jgi:hypothetical protein
VPPRPPQENEDEDDEENENEMITSTAAQEHALAVLNVCASPRLAMRLV